MAIKALKRTLKIDQSLYFRMEVLAAQRNVSVTDLIHEAVSDYLALPRIEKALEEAAQSLLSEAKAS